MHRAYRLPIPSCGERRNLLRDQTITLVVQVFIVVTQGRGWNIAVVVAHVLRIGRVVMGDQDFADIEKMFWVSRCQVGIDLRN